MNITDSNTIALSSSASNLKSSRYNASDDKTLFTPEKLKQQKVLALKLLLSYAFAVKHHLRGEDGTKWPDYEDVLPTGFARFDQIGYDRTTNTSYSPASSAQSKSPSISRKQSAKDQMWNPHTSLPNSQTPLLVDSHQTVEFHPYADELSLPLPMMYDCVCISEL